MLSFSLLDNLVELLPMKMKIVKKGFVQSNIKGATTKVLNGLLKFSEVKKIILTRHY